MKDNELDKLRRRVGISGKVEIYKYIEMCGSWELD